jgi:hypothetical protein
MLDSSGQEGGRLVLKLCSMCGEPTKSKYAMCQRPGPCGVEYRRLWARDEDKEHRNEVARRYRRSQKCAPSVYGVLFPAPGVLKIGLTTSSSSALYVGIARQGARKRGWDIADSSCIWKQPGDVRTEAWMQATLAFRWPGAFGKYQNRICEWFDVSGLPLEAVGATLSEIYREVPADLIREHRELKPAA